MIVAHFLRLNYDLKIQGLPLNVAITGDARNMKTYIETCVLQSAELAKPIILLVAPLVLRFNIGNLVLDVRDTEVVHMHLLTHRAIHLWMCTRLAIQTWITS